MPPFLLLGALLTLASIFGFLNYRYLHLPSAVGLVVVSLAASLCLVALDAALPGSHLRTWLTSALGADDLPQTFLNGALSLLLFSGSLHVDVGALWGRKVTVLLLATVGVVLAAVLFGAGAWAIFGFVGAPVALGWCLVLGAILAPTDPVVVADVLARVKLPRNLKAVMAGESLFNDGVAVVAFSALLAAVAAGTEAISAWAVAIDFLREAGGALVLGGVTGWLALELMRRIDDYPLEIMISLALAIGTYAFANALGLSGPIAVVLAGLLIGSRGTRTAMSEQTRRNLVLFWTIIDQLMNALLFLMLGLEAIRLNFEPALVLAGALAIPLALVVRAISVVAPVYWLHTRNPRVWSSAAVLTWSGLRGGISVALALSLPRSPAAESILVVCYVVVVFTIVVQGLTMARVIAWAFPNATRPASAPQPAEKKSPPRREGFRVAD